MSTTLWLKRIKPGVQPQRTHAAPGMFVEPIWTDGEQPPVGRACQDVYEVLLAADPEALVDGNGNFLAAMFNDYVNDAGVITDSFDAAVDLDLRTCVLEAQEVSSIFVLRHDGEELEQFRGIIH